MWYKNSLVITIVSVVLTLFICYFVAYGLTMYNFKLKNFLFFLVIATMMVPFEILMLPLYKEIIALHLIDTYTGVIIIGLCNASTIFFFRQYLSGLPRELLDAARIDGAGQWQSFWKIVMPNVKAAWLTLFLLSFQSLWGIGATSYIYKEELKTLPYALSQILSSGISRAGVGAAVSVFMLIVPVFIFIFSQSNIIETMASSGMKE